MTAEPDILDALAKAVLGETANRYMVSSANELRVAAIMMARQSKQLVRIFSHCLDSNVYDNGQLADALAKLAVRHRTSQVQILLRDPTAAATRGHHLVKLCQRFSSYVEVKRVGLDHREMTEEFMIADDRGLIFRSFADRFEGTISFDDRERLPESLSLFREAWEMATPETEFRRLHL